MCNIAYLTSCYFFDMLKVMYPELGKMAGIQLHQLPPSHETANKMVSVLWKTNSLDPLTYLMMVPVPGWGQLDWLKSEMYDVGERKK